MITGQLEQATEDAIHGLTALAVAYTILFDFRTTTTDTTSRTPHTPQSHPPLNLNVTHVINQVEQLAITTEHTICNWLGTTNHPYTPWWAGEPCPLIPQSLTTAARNLPQATTQAGHQIFELANHITQVVNQVRNIINQQDPATLTDNPCPLCQAHTLVQLNSPNRTICAIPDCHYEQRTR